MRHCSRQLLSSPPLRSRHSGHVIPGHVIRHVIPLRTPHRTLLDLSRGGKELGLTTPTISEDPLITSKLAAVDQTSPLSTALLNFSTDLSQDETFSQLTSLLPELDTTVLPLVLWAVLLRGAHCMYCRVRTTHALERALPHSEWFYKKHVELLYWQSRRDVGKMKEVGKEVKKYCTENALAGGPNMVRKRGIWQGARLLLLNSAGIYLFSQTYSTQLDQASFLWINSLLGPDSLYIFPTTNLILSCLIVALLKQGIILPSKLPKTLTLDLREHWKEQPLITALCTVPVIMICGKLFTVTCDQIPVVYHLFWTFSNATGLFVSYLVMKSNVVRQKTGLLPKQDFRILLAKYDLSYDPESIESEKRQMKEAEEEIRSSSVIKEQVEEKQPWEREWEEFEKKT